MMEDKLKKALTSFSRLNGRGPIKPTCREFQHKHGGRCVILTDTETGSWAMYNISWATIGRMQQWFAWSDKPYKEPLIEEASQDGSEKIS